MKIVVKAKTRAKEERVEQLTQPTLKLTGPNEPLVYRVSVKEAPEHGRANEAIVRALAAHFDIAPARIRLVTGQTAKQKIFEID